MEQRLLGLVEIYAALDAGPHQAVESLACANAEQMFCPLLLHRPQAIDAVPCLGCADLC
jgi:hypothetical protein